MPDENAFANALLEELQQQRNEALNRLAKSEANNIVLVAEIARLEARVVELEQGEDK